MGKRCHPTLTAFFPTTPSRVREEGKIFEGKAVVGGIQEVRAVPPFFPMPEASVSKALKPGRLHRGRFFHEGWRVKTPTPCSPCLPVKGHTGSTEPKTPLKTYSHLIPASLPTTTKQVWYLCLKTYFAMISCGLIQYYSPLSEGLSFRKASL